jgi:hypothetical protein
MPADPAVVIVQVRTAETRYTLFATLAPSGDLVLSGHDDSPRIEASFGCEEYEYFYRVRAAAVPLVCERLGVARRALLDGIRGLLARHGIVASSEWRKWLEANGVVYEFSVR